MLTFKVRSVRMAQQPGPTLAFVSINLVFDTGSIVGVFRVNGIKVVQGDAGLLVHLPARKLPRNLGYEQYFEAERSEDKGEIQRVVLAAYNEHIQGGTPC